MNNNDLLNKLLSISNLQVTRSEFSSDEQVILFVESSRPVASCPDCGPISDQVHDWSDVQMIRDLPIAVQRTAQEIWRAATQEPGGGIVTGLKSPVVAQCLEIAQNSHSATDTAKKVKQLLALSGQASLAGEIAQRAAVIAHQSKENRTNAFVKSLFSEASNYLVSRDLPGFVGAADKVRTVQTATELKTSIMRKVSSNVSSVPKPSGKLTSPKNWQKFVNSVVDYLSGSK